MSPANGFDAAAARSFELFGFAVLHNLFSDAEVHRLRREVEGALRERFGTQFGANTRDDMPAVSDDEVAAEGNFMPLMANRSPFSQHLVADDARLSSFAASVLGECTVASPALTTLLSSDTPWHNDPGIGARWLRLNAYLQSATAATGALRVVPASQHGSLPRDIARMLQDEPTARATPDALPGIALETEPGDVIAFDPRVHHSAWGGAARLRWSVDFVSLPSPSDSKAVKETRGLIEELSDWPTTETWPTWSEWAAGTSPRRRAAVEKLTWLGVL